MKMLLEVLEYYWRDKRRRQAWAQLKLLGVQKKTKLISATDKVWFLD